MWQKAPQNLLSLIFVIDVTITTRRPMMDYHCLLQCGVNCHITETISNKRWKQLGLKTKDWRGLEKFRNLFESTEWEIGAEGVRLNERCYLTLSLSSAWSILNEKGERKCRKFEWSLSKTIFRKSIVNYYHLNVCDLKLVHLYIIITNVFGVWKFLIKKSYSKNWKIDETINSTVIERI